MKTNLQRKLSELLEDEDFQRSIGTNELNFSNDQPTPSFGDLDIDAEKSNQRFDFQKTHYDPTYHNPNDYDSTDVESEVSDDDLSPDTLILEDGSLSPYENGDDEPADQSFTIVGEREIGGGGGWDEAELARKDPLDGKPWDGKESET